MKDLQFGKGQKIPTITKNNANIKLEKLWDKWYSLQKRQKMSTEKDCNNRFCTAFP